jgi:hypothetical protein
LGKPAARVALISATNPAIVCWPAGAGDAVLTQGVVRPPTTVNWPTGRAKCGGPAVAVGAGATTV